MLKNEYIPPLDPVDSLQSQLKQYSIEPPRKPLSLPLTPSMTLTHFRDLLTPYEQSEILGFKDVYFAGAAHVLKIGSSQRKTGADMGEKLNVVKTVDKEAAQGDVFNQGIFLGCLHNLFQRIYSFDDSRGDYYLTKHDHIGYRYEILSLLGKGSFGQVVKCYDHKKRVNVAVKLIRNKKRFEKQGVVEVEILSHLKEQDPQDQHSIIHIQDHFYFRNHLCITFELLGMNLYEWIKAGGFRGVHLGIVKRFAQQIMKSLSLLSRNHIIHCDLKPENILLKETVNTQPTKAESNVLPLDPCKPARIPMDFDSISSRYVIKVIDFGSSCFEDERIYTYVQSRFYRSPEIILGIPYTGAIDMWSLGCILTELYTGYPLFPGENENEQLACIMEIFGSPNIELIGRGSRKRHFFGNSLNFSLKLKENLRTLAYTLDSNGTPKISPNSKGKRRRPNTKSLTTSVGSGDASFLDFIRKCLEWDPLRRLTADEGLRHPWVTGNNSRHNTQELYGGKGGLAGTSMRTHVSYADRHVATSYAKSTSYGLLPQVKPSQFSKRENTSSHISQKHLGSCKPLENKAYTSSGLKSHATQTVHRLRPPIMDRLRGVDSTISSKKSLNTGLPPISFSNPALSKTKYASDKSLNLKNKVLSVESVSRDVPPWRI